MGSTRYLKHYFRKIPCFSTEDLNARGYRAVMAFIFAVACVSIMMLCIKYAEFHHSTGPVLPDIFLDYGPELNSTTGPLSVNIVLAFCFTLAFIRIVTHIDGLIILRRTCIVMGFLYLARGMCN